MAPGAEGAAEGLCAKLARELRDEMIRNQIANLPKNAELVSD